MAKKRRALLRETPRRRPGLEDARSAGSRCEHLHCRVCCLCCVWLLCSQRAAQSRCALGDGCDVELSHCKECACPRVRVPLSVPTRARGFSLCMWLGTGQISFSEMMKAGEGSPCHVSTSCMMEARGINTQLLCVLLPLGTLAPSVLS